VLRQRAAERRPVLTVDGEVVRGGHGADRVADSTLVVAMVIAEHGINGEESGVRREGDAPGGGGEGPAVLQPLPGAHVAGRRGVTRQVDRALPGDEGGGGAGAGDGRPRYERWKDWSEDTASVE